MANQEQVTLSLKMSTQEAEKGLEKVQQNIKATNKELKTNIDNFGFLGVTIGDVKGKFADLKKIGSQALSVVKQQGQQAALGLRMMFGGKMKKGATALFSAIKVGIASTGIGLLLVAFGSLLTFFTKTKRGAELLQVGFKAVGTAIAVITDRISSIGGAIVKVFQGDVKGAFDDVKNSVKGIGDEVVNETKQIIQLTKAAQQLKDNQRELNVETARRRAELESLKLIAEDTTKTEAERLEAAEKGMQIETELLAKRVANAEENLRIKQQEVDLGESLEEDFDELAQLEIELFNIRQESTTKQIELNNKINSIRKEGIAARENEEKERQAAQDERDAKELEKIKNRAALEQELALLKTEDDREREILKLEQDAEKLLAEEEDAEARRLINERLQLQIKQTNEKFAAEEIALSDQVKEKKKADDKAVADSKAQVGMQALGVMSDIVGRESAAGKSLAIAQSTINTYQAATNALANTPAPPPFPQIAAGVTVAAGLMQVRKIMATPPPEKLAQGGIVQGRGSGTSDSINARLSRGESVINAKSTRMFRPMLSAINEAGGGRGFADGGMIGGASGGITTGTVKAFVVADEMTNEQDRLNNIRRKATI
tara:strand:+ start:15729 stop:17537 length:1809 start_codon:yes stop_codon:yes gene_type:complete